MGLIRKSLAVGTLGVVKGSSKKQRVAKATLQALTPAAPPIERTSGGFQQVTRADGTKVTIIPRKAKKLLDAWRAAGNIKGLTLTEIVQRVGAEDAGSKGPGQNGLGYSLTWSRRGYTIGVWFGEDDRAIGILPGSERLG